MAKGQRFRHGNLIRLSRLLDMMYRPSELAEQIGVTTETIHRSYLPGGAPFTRDERGDVWIHGTSFVQWVEVASKDKDHWTLTEGQAWCFVCRTAVTMLRPRLKHEGRYTKIFQGRCAVCGGKVNRAYAASQVLEEVKG